MFLQVHFAPMNREQLKVIMWDTMVEAYGDTCNFLIHVYENYFSQLHQFFSQYTSNVWEFAYVMKFLYPRYVEKLYQLKCDAE